MGRFLRFWIAIFVIGILTAFSEVSALSPKTLSSLRQSVFEVVVPKLENEAITYKEPLPLDMLPYSIRTDKYLSVGTAFLVGPNQFLTAAHVLGLQGTTQWGPFYIRSASGDVYKIKDILSYSHQKDYVGFNVENPPNASHLAVNRNPKIDTTVFAVGNALGEGIVAREGLFTSLTPEHINGDWEWIRFSAPTSPGNSGGPLLDYKGKVIGIVQRKSPNENLNFALPIQHALDDQSQVGVFRENTYFYIPNINKKKDMLIDINLSLPMPIASFRAQLTDRIAAASDAVQAVYLDELSKSEESFPKGANANNIVYSMMAAPVPLLVEQKENDLWRIDDEDYRQFELGNPNQLIVVKSHAHHLLAFFEKGKDLSLKTLLEDDQLIMDYFLETGLLKRFIATQDVVVTSLGKAESTQDYVDRHGRKWQLKTWRIPYSDRTIMFAILPVPSGVAMFIYEESTAVDFYIESTKVMLDYVLQSYDGTYEEWETFLSLDYVPDFLKDTRIAKTEEKIEFEIASLNIKLKAPYLDSTETYNLLADIGFNREHGNTVMGIQKLSIGGELGDEYVEVRRFQNPEDNVVTEIKNRWKSIITERPPFDGEVQSDGGGTYIFKVEMSPETPTPNYAKVYSFITSGKKTDEEINARLDSVLGE